MKKILLAVLLLGLIGGGIGYYLWNKPVPSVERQKAAHTLSATELLNAFQQDQSTAQEKYLGQIIAVSGVIDEIIPGEGLRMQVVLETETPMSTVGCVLEEDAEQFIKRGLKKGDQVTIKGKCTGAMDDLLGMQVIVDPAVVVE